MMLKKLIVHAAFQVSAIFAATGVFAQSKDWHKPITSYADNLLSGVQTTVTTVGVLVVIGLFGWGFFTKNPGLYKWALGGVAIVILAKLAPTLMKSLTAIGS